MKNKSLILLAVVAPVLLVSCSNSQGSGQKVPARTESFAPILSRDGKTITYGEYPTEIVYDDNLINQLDKIKNTESSSGKVVYNGNTYFDGSFAAKRYDGITASMYSYYPSFFQKWYKVESIVWDVLDVKDNEYFVWCSKVIDAVAYRYESKTVSADYQGNPAGTIYEHNYQFSEARRFLNVDFINIAFDGKASYVLTTNVDNSAASNADMQIESRTPYVQQYACENTNDKIFLLSSAELTNSNYGFDTLYDVKLQNPSSTRQRKTTDFSRNAGADKKSENLSCYYTRSPNCGSEGSATIVTETGAIGAGAIASSVLGIAPAMRVSFKNQDIIPQMEDTFTPVISSDKKSITFGEYPTTKIYDPTLISALNKLKNSESSTGKVVYNGETYFDGTVASKRYEKYEEPYKSYGKFVCNWYKVEPIVWDVLEAKNNEYFVWSHNILDGISYVSPVKVTADYQGNPAGSYYNNNYQFSEVRRLLNVDFFSLAFENNGNHILTTTVDNSPSSNIDYFREDRKDNAAAYACDNTQDRFFLLSSKDLTNQTYGFETTSSYYGNTPSATRTRGYSDFAQATGSNNYYYTRSPSGGSSGFAIHVEKDGSLGSYMMCESFIGIVPAMRIVL